MAKQGKGPGSLADLDGILEGRETPPVILLAGDDAAAREEVLRRLETALCPSGQGWVVLDGESCGAGEILAALSTGSLFGGGRRVVVRHAEALAAGEAEALAQGLAGLGPGACLILVHGGPESKGKLFQAAARAGRVVICKAPRGEELPRWVDRRSRQAGLRLTRAGTAALLAATGPDPMALATEIEKLALAAGDEGGPMDEGAVAAAVSRALPHAAEYAAFQVVDAALEARPAQALKVLGELLALGDHPLRLLGLLARQLRLVLLAGALARRGLRPEQAQAELGVSSPFVLRKLFRQARRIPPGRARQALERVLATDEKLKEGREGRIALETLLLELALLAGAEAR